MRPIPVLILGVAAALSGCASAGSALPVCDGKHLRSANPHGSVLDSAAPATDAAKVTPPEQPGCGQ